MHIYFAQKLIREIHSKTHKAQRALTAASKQKKISSRCRRWHWL